MTAQGEPERTYTELRERVRKCHQAVTERDSEEAGTTGEERSAAGSRFDEAVDLLVEATDHLLAFEDRLPVLKDLPARALSVQVVRAAALATGLGGLLVALGIWREVLAWWWAPGVMIAVVATVRMANLPVAPAAGKHRRQRYWAVVCGAAALLTGPAAALQGWLAGLACAAVHLLCLAVLLDLPRGRT